MERNVELESIQNSVSNALEEGTLKADEMFRYAPTFWRGNAQSDVVTHRLLYDCRGTLEIVVFEVHNCIKFFKSRFLSYRRLQVIEIARKDGGQEVLRPVL